MGKRLKIVTIRLESFDQLQERGHCVPRDEGQHIMYGSFNVGKEYLVRHSASTKTLRVKCTQDCPTNLKLIWP